MKIFKLAVFFLFAGTLSGQNDSLRFTLRGSLVYSDDKTFPVANSRMFLIVKSDTIEIVNSKLQSDFAYFWLLSETVQKPA